MYIIVISLTRIRVPVQVGDHTYSWENHANVVYYTAGLCYCGVFFYSFVILKLAVISKWKKVTEWNYYHHLEVSRTIKVYGIICHRWWLQPYTATCVIHHFYFILFVYIYTFPLRTIICKEFYIYCKWN